jgi:segregation and condensation protein A
VIDGVALARLYGEPLFQLPRPLHPAGCAGGLPGSLPGPLDLLLYLIRKQNFNILDIPLAQVTAQYLEYVEQIRKQNLELAAEYLLMAAMLIEIKSRMLLPAKKAEPGEEQIRAPSWYAACWSTSRSSWPPRSWTSCRRSAATSCAPRSTSSRPWSRAGPRSTSTTCKAVWADILKRAKLTQHHHISREELSVREHMTGILRRLQSARFVEFSDLFDPSRGVPVVVVNFIALLELAKETLIEITQAEAFAPIYVRLSYSPS